MSCGGMAYVAKSDGSDPVPLASPSVGESRYLGSDQEHRRIGSTTRTNILGCSWILTIPSKVSWEPVVT